MPLLDVLALFRATDSDSDTVSGALAYFYEAGTSTPVTTYSDETLVTANTWPLVADAAGIFGPVYVEEGEFKVAIHDADDVKLMEADNVLVESLPYTQSIADFQGLTFLIADERLSYSPGADVIVVEAGDIVRAGANIYEVAPEDATDWHVKTTGGVKLYERGPHFTSLNRFLNTIARIDDFAVGQEITAGGESYRKFQDATGDTGWFSVDDFIHPLVERKLDDAKGSVKASNLSDGAKQAPFTYHGALGAGGIDFAAPDQDASSQLRYGTATGTGSGTFTVTYPEPFSVDSLPLGFFVLDATAGTNGDTYEVKSSNPTATGFTARALRRPAAGGAAVDAVFSFSYIAIGR